VDTSCHVLKWFAKCVLVGVENTERFMSVTPAGMLHMKIKIIFFPRLSRRLRSKKFSNFKDADVRYLCTLSSFPRSGMELALSVVY
jgi:hypothetical protein